MATPSLSPSPSSTDNQTYTIINCQWPCPGEGTACIVTNTSIACGRQENSPWVLTGSSSSPVFRGETADLYQPCVIAPSPTLPSSNATPLANQTRINWPLTGDPARPWDKYLSDCQHLTYCSTGMCIPRLQANQHCDSTNQCLHGQCVQGLCQGSPVSSVQPSPTPSSHRIVTPGIIAGISVATTVCLAVIILIVMRRLFTQRCLSAKKKPPSSNAVDVPVTIPCAPSANVPCRDGLPAFQQAQYDVQVQQEPYRRSPPPAYSP